MIEYAITLRDFLVRIVDHQNDTYCSFCSSFYHSFLVTPSLTAQPSSPSIVSIILCLNDVLPYAGAINQPQVSPLYDHKAQ